MPVVSDRLHRQLAGIITDRDLVIRILAEGRDPSSVRVSEVMITDPVHCYEDDNIHEARRAMSTHEIRDIPVVDDQDRLVGVITQHDLAMSLRNNDVDDMVEDISQPFGEIDWNGGGLRPTALKPLLTGMLCFGAGMGLAYLLGQQRSGREQR